MKKKSIAILLTAVLLASLFLSCSPQKEIHGDGSSEQETAPSSGSLSYKDFIDSGKTIAAQIGDVYPEVARDFFKAKEVQEYASMADMLESMRMGKVDAVLLSHGYVKQLQDSGMYPDFAYLWVPEDVYVNKAGPIFHTGELRDRYNEWFAKLAADGTWQEIVDRWIGVPIPAQEDIPQFEFTGENGILYVCDTGDYPPLTYFDANGEHAGFDVEMISLFAQHMGMKPEFTMMAYDAVVPYVASGKAAMSACTLTITDEREESILFGEPSIITQAVLVVPNADAVSGSVAGLAETSGKNTLSYTDFAGKDIAAIVGATHYMTIEKIGGNPIYYNDSPEAAEEVRRGTVSGFMTILSNARVMASQLNGFEVIPVPKEVFNSQTGGISDDAAVIDRFNVFLASIKADGTFADMEARWFSDEIDLNAPMPKIDNSGKNGVLRVATSALSMPYVYYGENGELKGFSAELALRFGAYEEKEVEFAEMDFSALIPYIKSGKAEISLSSMSITEERKQSVLFTDPFHDEQHGIIALKPVVTDTKTDVGSSISWIKTGIERNLITDNRWKMIVDGLGVTMTIAVLAQIFGTVFGAFICWLLMRKNRFVKWIGNLYCGLIYGTPIVVLLMITYYIIFGDTSISNVLVAVAAFTMITGASVALNLKGSIETVDPVEIEAARSIGFSSFKAFCTVTLPQAVRRAMPGYTNGFVELVKATAIVGYIAIQDLTRAGDIIRSRTYDAYFPLLFVAIIYLIVTTICVQLFKLIIKKINGGVAN